MAEQDIRAIDRMVAALKIRFSTATSSVELDQFRCGATFDEQRNEVPDGSAFEAGVLLVHDLGDAGRLHLCVGIGQAPGQLVDDLLFAQLDH
ncbi:MAG TPA: hypothetical protein VEX40_14400 [Mycobacterium sp.]|nr:hypothetical protein [Mycobacterium sp.]